jgi:hypothetical protein
MLVHARLATATIARLDGCGIRGPSGRAEGGVDVTEVGLRSEASEMTIEPLLPGIERGWPRCVPPEGSLEVRGVL